MKAILLSPTLAVGYGSRAVGAVDMDRCVCVEETRKHIDTPMSFTKDLLASCLCATHAT